MELPIEVECPAGGIFELAGQTSWSIRDVKLKVEKKRGIPLNVQSIWSGTRRLSDTDLLSSIPEIEGKLRLILIRRIPEQVHWLKLVERESGRASLEQAPEAIRADSEIMLAAAAHDPKVLRHAHQKLLGSSDFMKLSAACNPDCLEWAAQNLWADPEFVLFALRHSWRSMFKASEELRSDRDFMLKAIMINRWALQGASDELRADTDFVTLTFTSWRREFILNHMQFDGSGLRRANDLRKDRDVVRAAVNSKGTALEYADPELQADRSIVLDAVRNDPDALQWAAPSLQGDRQIVMAAMQNDERAKRWAKGSLMAEETFQALLEDRRTHSKRSSSVSVDFSRPATSVTFQQVKLAQIPVGRAARNTRRPQSATGLRSSGRPPRGIGSARGARILQN
jgi:hypothetical protein